MRSVLVTRPQHDEITKYFYAWSEVVLTEARTRGVVYDLCASKATRKNFESFVKNKNPSFIFLNGHGDAERIAGHENDILVDSASSLPHTVMYARSCDAAQVLGRQLVSKGTQTFIGYTRKFICGYSPDKVWRPLEDPIARLFLEPSNLVASTLIKGHSAQEAHERSRTAMYKNFRKMLSSAASFEERYAARWLWSNINCQVLLGDTEATI
jgi:hypothetical protein